MDGKLSKWWKCILLKLHNTEQVFASPIGGESQVLWIAALPIHFD